MRLLLDTHIAIWAIGKVARLPPLARDLILDPANSVAVSAVSIWEITIKHAFDRGRPNDIAISGATALGYFRDAGFEIIPILPEHAIAVADLPSLHKDPFDRLLVAQAKVETLQILTSDKIVAAYGGMVTLV